MDTQDHSKDHNADHSSDDTSEVDNLHSTDKPQKVSKIRPAIDVSLTPGEELAGSTDETPTNEADRRAVLLAQMRKALATSDMEPNAERLDEIKEKIESGFYSESASNSDVIQRIMDDLFGQDPF